MYYTKNNIKITARKYIDEDGNQYDCPQWFDGAADEQLTALGITRHADAIKPAYDSATQKLIVLDSGEYGITNLTQKEIDSRKVNIVTMRQARLALLSSGLLNSIDQVIAAMPSPQMDAALIEWEYAATVDRNSPLVAGLTVGLGLSEQQLDDLFESASKIL